jgi:pilus assembly protein Flp/PilA
MKNFVVRFVREEEGQDLIEYSLLAAIIAVGAIAVMGDVRDAINTVFTKVVTALKAA